ncbi:MAG: sigma-54 dependent transcriptional regulator [Thermodesulfobacteriota bacterium]
MMNLNQKEIVRQLTLSVFSSPGPESSLSEIFRFLKRFFPLDLLNLPIMQSGRGVMRYRALVTDEDVMLIDETVRLSEAAKIEIEKVFAEKVAVINEVHQNLATREVAAHFSVEDSMSTLVIAVELEPALYGAFGLVAMGRNRYQEKHRRLLERLFEPLAGVIRHLRSQLEYVRANELLTLENLELRKRLGYLGGLRVIGAETGLREVMAQVEQIARLESPVLLMGETGVGKEVVANAIHHGSNRSVGPLISLNCGAIPETLLDSELFGFEKGAFTGAVNLKRGYFEQADGGTVFLDEIGELSPSAQVKLLRLLQTMEFQRVGGNRVIAIDVRVIAATNRDLFGMVKAQQFRQDLWFRLNVFPIRIPPLRERKQDIPTLAEYFARRKAIELNLPGRPSFAPGAATQLQAYDWPGNVRELLNVIERALIINRGHYLSFPNLDQMPEGSDETASHFDQGRLLTLDAMMARHIRLGLDLCRGRINGRGGAAQVLGLNPSTLRGRMRKLGIRIQHSTN